jgi:hypothetical protein
MFALALQFIFSSFLESICSFAANISVVSRHQSRLCRIASPFGIGFSILSQLLLIFAKTEAQQ